MVNSNVPSDNSPEENSENSNTKRVPKNMIEETIYQFSAEQMLQFYQLTKALGLHELADVNTGFHDVGAYYVMQFLDAFLCTHKRMGKSRGSDVKKLQREWLTNVFVRLGELHPHLKLSVSVPAS